MDEKRLAAVLVVDFARTLTSDFSIQTILDHLVDHVVEVIPVDGAGVLLMDSDTEHHIVAASDDVILGVEALQMDLHEGPCLQAYRTGNRRGGARPRSGRDVTPLLAGSRAGWTWCGLQLSAATGRSTARGIRAVCQVPLDLSDADLVGAQILAVWPPPTCSTSGHVKTLVRSLEPAPNWLPPYRRVSCRPNFPRYQA